MRIDSSNIGMESERTYSAVSTRVTKVTITDSRQSTMDGTDSLFGNLLESGQEEMPEMKSEEEESPQDFLSKTLDEMRAKVNAFRLGQISDLDMEETGRQNLSGIRIGGKMSYVGNVHNTLDLVAYIAQIPVKHVLHSVCTEISYMRKMIDRGTAGIHRYLPHLSGLELVL